MAYAIIKTGGKQYKVSEGDHIDVEKLDIPVGDKTTFSQVLCVSDDSGLKIGNPFVDGAAVTAEVVDQFRAKKVIAFKFRRRKGYHKTRGHRRMLTKLSIIGISA
jgi:large subunit ribosomal protein L21